MPSAVTDTVLRRRRMPAPEPILIQSTIHMGRTLGQCRIPTAIKSSISRVSPTLAKQKHMSSKASGPNNIKLDNSLKGRRNAMKRMPQPTSEPGRKDGRGVACVFARERSDRLIKFNLCDSAFSILITRISIYDGYFDKTGHFRRQFKCLLCLDILEF